MEEYALYDWLFELWFVVVIVGIIAFKICADLVKEKKERKMGVTSEKCDMIGCNDAARMLVDYIYHRMDGDKRQHEECIMAGCDGNIVVRESKDVGLLVNFVHKAGGRLVARRVSEKDIECENNTVLEVKKQLTELDIARAKRIKDKY